MPKHKNGKRAPKIHAKLLDENFGIYGKRKSLHQNWQQCHAGERQSPEGWSWDAADFCSRLVGDIEDYRIKIVAKNSKGKIIERVIVNPDRQDQVAHEICAMRPDKHNVLFSPIPIGRSGPLQLVRNGWVTIKNAHPLTLFPHPAIFWRVSNDSYQAVIPWHSLRGDDRSCEEAMETAPDQKRATLKSSEEDLLFMPGSLIHRPGLAPFVARVEYDAFTATSIENHNFLWNQY